MNNVIVTTSWDDGHALDLKLALLLKQYGVEGTFYITPRNRQFPSNELLNTTDIVALSADVEIGAHSMTHPLLSTLTTEQSREEIVDSKHYLEALLKKPITCFCYPSGDYTKEHVDQVRSAGFTLARTTKRFHLERSSTLLEMPTSIHAYRHWSDMWDIAKFSRGNPIAFFRYLFHWDALAIAMFDRVLSSGGVFHLWGHSWEIEKNGHWQALQRVLRHISGRAGVSYLPNSALI